MGQRVCCQKRWNGGDTAGDRLGKGIHGRLVLWIVWAALAAILVFPTRTPAQAQVTDSELIKDWSGDYEGMVKRRQVRVLVVPNKMYYFLDRGHPRGVNVDLFREFEKFINKRAKTGARAIHVIFVPVPRDLPPS